MRKCCYPNYFLKAEYDYDSHEGNAIGYIEAWKNSTLYRRVKDMSHRVYLDYNVIEDVSKGRICLPVGDYDIFCSVAHGEEYYNACCNASTEYIEAAFEVKKTINNISKKGIVLNPAKRGVRAKAEKFEDCIDRIRKFDTRDIVNRNGSFIFQNNKDTVAELRKSDFKSVNNSNLGCEEI